jgi:hypothetical protein
MLYDFIVYYNCYSDFKCINFIFFTDIAKPYSILDRLNLYTAFCRLSPLFDVMSWLPAYSNVNSCIFQVAYLNCDTFFISVLSFEDPSGVFFEQACFGMVFPPILMKHLYLCDSVVIA